MEREFTFLKTFVATPLGDLEKKAVLIKNPILIEWVFYLGVGTRVHLSVAEKLRFGWYDGCQAAVWALGMMLVESRSPCLLSSIRRPHTVFSKPEKALKQRCRIPEHLTPGNVINNLF